MNAILGQIGVALGLVSAVCGAGVIAAGLLKDRPRWLAAAPKAAWGVLAGALLATAAMEHALITHDFSLAYVADNNARVTPLLYSITGMWAALQGVDFDALHRQTEAFGAATEASYAAGGAHREAGHGGAAAASITAAVAACTP